jgi:integrase
MSTFNNKRSALNKTKAAVSEPDQPDIRFVDVLKAVNDEPNLTPRVRQNLRTAVTRTAHLMSPLGLQCTVNVQAIGKKLDKLAPAQLGFKTGNALAAYKSNLRRALRLAGVTVMPGRHVTPLSAPWQALLDSIPEIVTDDGLKENPIKIHLTRFAHVASERGWAPDAVDTGNLKQFGTLLAETCLNSKFTRVARETAAAWAEARTKIKGWPQNELGNPERHQHGYALPWSAFPDSFRADVEAFVTRAELDDLDDFDEDGAHQLRPLGKRTVRNYGETCLRAASILVRLGQSTETIGGLKELVTIQNIKLVARFLAERNQRTEGGAPFQTALILYIAAKHHLHLPEPELERIKRYWKKIRGRYGKMSDRTFRRLQQFDDPKATEAMAKLPDQLLKVAQKLGKPSVESAKLVRTALLLALAQDTCLRAGNLVGIDVHKHLSVQQRSAGPLIADLVIPAGEVKNGVEVVTRLSSETSRLLKVWLNDYRPTQFAINCNCSWLFPNTKGGHRSVSQALEDVKDLSARYAGLDVTPHLMRAYVGKVVLDETPDGHVIVQQVLGHKSLKTTVQYYTPVREAMARARLHGALGRLRGRS